MGTAIMGVPSREGNHTPEDAVSRREDQFEVNVPPQRPHHWQLHWVGSLAEVVPEGLEHVQHNVGLTVFYMAHVLNTHSAVPRWNLWDDGRRKIFLSIRKCWLGSNILEVCRARGGLDKVINARDFSSNINEVFKVENSVGVELAEVEEGAGSVVGEVSAAQTANVLVLSTVA